MEKKLYNVRRTQLSQQTKNKQTENVHRTLCPTFTINFCVPGAMKFSQNPNLEMQLKNTMPSVGIRGGGLWCQS